MSQSNNIGKQIALEIKKFYGEFSEEIEAAAKKTANEAAQKLRVRSPKKTGVYAKGWKVKKVRGAYVVHNQNKPRLTHLLEYGYYNKKGNIKVQGNPHIGPTEQEAINDFAQRVEEVIK